MTEEFVEYMKKAIEHAPNEKIKNQLQHLLVRLEFTQGKVPNLDGAD